MGWCSGTWTGREAWNGRRREWKFKWQWDNDTSVGAKECQTKEEVIGREKIGRNKAVFFLSWGFTVILCVLFLLKSNCKD